MALLIPASAARRWVSVAPAGSLPLAPVSPGDPFGAEVVAAQGNARLVTIANRAALDTYLAGQAGGINAGDRIEFTSNTPYEGGDITFTSPGVQGNPIVWCCNGNGNRLVPKLCFKITLKGTYCDFWGLKFQKDTKTPVQKTGRLLFDAVNNVVVQRCEFSGWLPDKLGAVLINPTGGSNGHAIEFVNIAGQDHLIERCFFHDPGDWGAAEIADNASNAQSLRIFVRQRPPSGAQKGLGFYHKNVTFRCNMFASTILRPRVGQTPSDNYYNFGQADLFESGGNVPSFLATDRPNWQFFYNIFDGTGEGGACTGCTFDRTGDVDPNPQGVFDHKISGLWIGGNTCRNFRNRSGKYADNSGSGIGRLDLRGGEADIIQQNFFKNDANLGIAGGKHIILSNDMNGSEIYVFTGDEAWNSYTGKHQSCDNVTLQDNDGDIFVGRGNSGIDVTNTKLLGTHVGTINCDDANSALYSPPAGFTVAFAAAQHENGATFSQTRLGAQFPLVSELANTAVGPFS